MGKHGRFILIGGAMLALAAAAWYFGSGQRHETRAVAVAERRLRRRSAAGRAQREAGERGLQQSAAWQHRYLPDRLWHRGPRRDGSQALARAQRRGCPRAMATASAALSA